MRGMAGVELVKENRPPAPPLALCWLAAALGGAALALGGAALLDAALPAPRSAAAPPHLFSAQRAHRHLRALTDIGPRVAGSYENEVSAVRVLVTALRALAAGAGASHRLEVEVHAASGAFPLAFLDGMNNAYRDVQSVVARVSPASGRPSPCARTALLLNCHFDTVPDSPGASDDGAGCAVLLEVLRALVSAPRALAADAVFLFNGAEENILQASHAFITAHRWARCVRAFVNLEACGAGGREVVFQAGPRDPWLLDVYAAAAPRPFASSLAQELFASGLVPADTDFRIFRDFGNLSGVDLAWSANGYVYHTRLDTADRVPPAALQRTGDNVLALTHGLLASGELLSEVDVSARAPVFFDVLGLFMVTARAPSALAAVVATLLLVLAKIHLNARAARKHLGIGVGEWWRCVGRAALSGAAGALGGVAAAGGVGLALHCGGARLAYYARPWLLAPLFALPALGAGGGCARLAWARGGRRGWAARGWWGARAAGDAAAGGAALALGAAAALGLRSGFVPLLWALLPALADLAASPLPPSSGYRAVCWCAGASGPTLQTWYLALGLLRLLVPVVGRAGSPPLPPDVAVGAVVGALVLLACHWLLPLLLATREPRALAWGALCACAAGAVVAASAGAYSAERPQRLMVFHTRRTDHTLAEPAAQLYYWVPALDANTPHSLYEHVAGLRAAAPVDGAECARLVYCGAPYYLPVAGLVRRSHRLPAPTAPLPRLSAHLSTAPLDDTTRILDIHINGSSHVVAIVSPAEGAAVRWATAEGAGSLRPRAARPWGGRHTYFFTLHDARARPWHLRLLLTHAAGAAPAQWAQVSLAAHAQFGPQRLAAAHRALLAATPPWVAATGWGVDLHLYAV